MSGKQREPRGTVGAGPSTSSAVPSLPAAADATMQGGNNGKGPLQQSDQELKPLHRKSCYYNTIQTGVITQRLPVCPIGGAMFVNNMQIQGLHIYI